MLFENQDFTGYLGSIGNGSLPISQTISGSTGTQCTVSGMSNFFPDCNNTQDIFESTAKCYKLIDTDTQENINGNELGVEDLFVTYMNDHDSITRTHNKNGTNFRAVEVLATDSEFEYFCGPIDPVLQERKNTTSTFMGVYGTLDNNTLLNLSTSLSDWKTSQGDLMILGPQDQFQCDCVLSNTKIVAWAISDLGWTL